MTNGRTHARTDRGHFISSRTRPIGWREIINESILVQNLPIFVDTTKILQVIILNPGLFTLGDMGDYKSLGAHSRSLTDKNGNGQRKT